MSETTHFGERTVPLEEKQGLVDDVFHGVADRYDLMNDLMSGGVHRLWKDAHGGRLAPPKTGRVPIACSTWRAAPGTSPSASSMPRSAMPKSPSADINSDMLRVGEERAKKWRFPVAGDVRRGQCGGAAVCGRELSTPTPSPSASETCRASTMALSEAHRVLKRGGRFLCLEFSRVDLPVLDRAYQACSRIGSSRRSGRVVTGDANPTTISSNRSATSRRPAPSRRRSRQRASSA